MTLSNNTHIQKHSHQNLVPKYCNITLQSYSVQDSRTISCEVQLFSLQEMISLQELKCHSTSLFLLRALTNIQLTFFFMLSLGRAWSRPPHFLLCAITFSTSFCPGHLSLARKLANLFLISSSSAGVHFFLVRLFSFFFLTDFFSETIFHIIRLILFCQILFSNCNSLYHIRPIGLTVTR